MRRRLFNFFAWLSLLLWVAVLGLAISSVYRSVWISYRGRSHTAMVASIGSAHWFTVWFDAIDRGRGLQSGSDPSRGWYSGAVPSGWPQFLGSSLYVGLTDPDLSVPIKPSQTYVTLIVPHWMLAIVTAVLPMMWLIGHKRRSRRRKGLCLACGYDLRESPLRCPECGTSASAPGGKHRVSCST